VSEPRLVVAASPHLRAPLSSARIMWTVSASLLPVVAAAAWWFGVSAFLVIAAAVAGAAAAERTFSGPGRLRDGSAVLTGLLLALSLPPGLPAWMAFVGGAVGIALGKAVFGGLGQNVFNPALLGRAFLQAAFPVAITTWARHHQGFFVLAGDTLALPFTVPHPVDGTTAATPLGAFKFEGRSTGFWDLLVGDTGGSLGETCDLAILLGGLVLASLRLLAWRVPVAVFASVAALAALLHAALPAGGPYHCPDALTMLASGGLTLGAVYMATDPVTSPITQRGAYVFGAGVGALVVLIRVFGGLAEGVMYAILIMNALVPFIDRYTQPRVFGTGRPRREAAP
jgi:electron transport complex protein RnfD